MNQTKKGIDLILDKYILEVESDLKANRSFLTSIMDLATKISGSRNSVGVLIINNPAITKERLKKESEEVSKILNPEVVKRLRIVLVEGDDVSGLLGELDSKLRKEIEEYLKLTKTKARSSLLRSDYYYILLEILVNRWLRKEGPMTTKWLMETAGCSYPTVALALHRLGDSVKRYSSRRVELRQFPKDEWNKLVVVSDRVRSTTRFADRSGRPRSPEELFHRFQKLHRNDVAVGGTFGAKYYYPDLDLVGNPRLDLSVHAPQKDVDLSFVEVIDPALKKVERAHESASLVLHFVRRKNPLFELESNNVNWADPAECLLDLHEARLESQALEFVKYFTSSPGRFNE